MKIERSEKVAIRVTTEELWENFMSNFSGFTLDFVGSPEDENLTDEAATKSVDEVTAMFRRFAEALLWPIDCEAKIARISNLFKSGDVLMYGVEMTKVASTPDAEVTIYISEYDGSPHGKLLCIIRECDIHV